MILVDIYLTVGNDFLTSTVFKDTCDRRMDVEVEKERLLYNVIKDGLVTQRSHLIKGHLQLEEILLEVVQQGHPV